MALSATPWLYLPLTPWDPGEAKSANQEWNKRHGIKSYHSLLTSVIIVQPVLYILTTQVTCRK